MTMNVFVFRQGVHILPGIHLPVDHSMAGLLTTLFVLALAITVFLKEPGSAVHQFWSFFLLCLALTGFGDFLLSISSESRVAEIVNRIGGVGWYLAPSFFLHFTLQYTQYQSPFSRRWNELLIYGPGLVFSAFQSLGYVTKSVPLSSGYGTGYAEGYWAYAVWFAIVVCVAFYVVYSASSSVRSKRERTQAWLAIIGVGVLFSVRSAAVVSPSLDFLAWYGVPAATAATAALGSFVVIRRRPDLLTSLSTVRGIVNEIEDLLAITDVEGFVVFCNKAFRKAVHHDGVEVRGMHISAFVEDGAGVLDAARKSADSVSKSLSVGVTYRNSNNSTFPVSLTVSPVLDGGEPVGYVFLANDVSERKELTKKYEETQKQYQNIVENSLDGIIIVQEGRLVYVNPTAVNIFGYGSPEEMKKVNFVDTVAPASRPFLFDTRQGLSIGMDILKNYELKGLTKQGRLIDLEANARVIEWNGKAAVQTSFRDISERKMLEREQALWLWEQESLMTIDRQLVAMVDLQRVLDAICHHARVLTRADYAGVVIIDAEAGRYTWRAMSGNVHPPITEPLPLGELHREMLKNIDSISIHDFGANPRFPVDQFPVLQRENLVSVRGLPLRVGGNLHGMLIVGYRKQHEFSAREVRLLTSLAEKSSIALSNAELYENLRGHEKELELLSGARVQAQEDERRRIAREIHDGLGQMLTAIKFNLEILEDTISPGQDERRRIEDMKNLLDNLMKDAREISYNLMPSVLDDFGLAPALQLLSEQVSQQTRMKVLFHAHGFTERLGPALEIGLYRIAQEALNNAAKHADATEINLQIIRHGDGIRLTVEDNGKGISSSSTAKRASHKGGMGLMSMRERVSSFKGTLTIDSSPGKGTIVNVEIPAQRGENHA